MAEQRRTTNPISAAAPAPAMRSAQGRASGGKGKDHHAIPSSSSTVSPSSSAKPSGGEVSATTGFP